MGLLKHFRSKSRLKDDTPRSAPKYKSYSAPSAHYYGPNLTARLPDNVVENIFTYVCPHTADTSYEPSERSQIGDGCMLCDLRDLARCAQVCRKWYSTAQKLLYGSVRIDAVHYCALEEELAEKRRKAGKGFRNKNSVVEPGEVPNIRLGLLCRTVREQPALAALVLVMKLPYMTRETAKGDLARCISALSNLRYVDLPDGFFTGDPSCLALRQELQARCPDIRKMSYRGGSEDALELLAHRHWQSIEILELNGLSIEPTTLRVVLASLPTLRDLTLSDMPWFDDTIFMASPGQVPDFPPVQALKLDNLPNVTAHGLQMYHEAPNVREMLLSLTLRNTGVTVQDLHSVLWRSSNLHQLSIIETVTKSLALTSQQLPPLQSISLKILHFEITSSEDVHGLQRPGESHYAYLAASLHQNALPALTTLYVRDPSFPELLILPPISHPYAVGGSDSASLRSKPSNASSVAPSASLHSGQRMPHNAGAAFSQTLEVFSKGIDELEWVFTSISPATTNDPNGSLASVVGGGRPLSAYSASRGLGPQWAQGGFGGEARKSVMVGNGFGGFLAVPQEEVPRPMTAEGGGYRDVVGGTRWGSVGSQESKAGSAFLRPPPSVASSATGHERRGSRHDLWR